MSAPPAGYSPRERIRPGGGRGCLFLRLLLVCGFFLAAGLGASSRPSPSPGAQGGAESPSPLAASPSSLPSALPATPSALPATPSAVPPPRAGAPSASASPPGFALRQLLPGGQATSTTAAPVVLDGITYVHLPAYKDLAATERALIVEKRLEQVLAQATQVPEVSFEVLDGYPTLRSGDVYIITVTNQDAEHEGRSKTEAAVEWRAGLEKGLASSWRLRSGEYFRGAVTACAALLVLGLTLHVLIGYVVRRLFSLPGALPQLLMWVGLTVAILWQFPATRELSKYVQANLALPLVGIVTVLGLGFVAWFASVTYIRRLFNGMRALREKDAAMRPRSLQRLEMARQVTQVMANVVIFVLVMMGLLTVLHINPTTLLASAGVIGVAMGVATQDPAKDLTNGLAVLVEDQFGVGDIIKTAGVEGEVVGFSIRSTQIRTVEGSLITLPNSMVRGVENQSNEWAQVDFRMTIRYDRKDIPRALALMEQAVNELGVSHADMVLDLPTMLGLEALTSEGAVLRMLVKTEPYKQREVRRLLLHRVAELFDEADIQFPVLRRTPS